MVITFLFFFFSFFFFLFDELIHHLSGARVSEAAAPSNRHAGWNYFMLPLYSRISGI